jgi:hypothetical protein
MNTENIANSEKSNWIQVKAKIIQHFGRVDKAAAFFGCHRSALRLAVTGQCPQVAEKMKKAGLLEGVRQ